MDWWQQLTDPFHHGNEGRGTTAAPGSPENARRTRIANLNRAPRPGENFVDYATRLPPPPAPPPAPAEAPDVFPFAHNNIVYRAQMRQQAEEHQRTMVLRPDSRREARQRIRAREASAPPDPAHVVGQGAIDEYNRPSMILADIPMGTSAVLPRIAHPYKPQGRNDRAVGVRLDNDLHPVALRLGTFNWNTDERRPVSDVLNDVTIATGAPRDMLNMIGRRENFPYLDLYDQPPTEGGGVSSARGPHQFTTGTFKTWFNGLGEMYGVPVTMTDPERQDLVNDPRFSGAMTAEMARYHYDLYRRQHPNLPAPSIADIYLFHHGGEEAIPLVAAVHGGRGNVPAPNFYSAQAVNNHLNDFYVAGNRAHPRTADQFWNWMTGQDGNSPHRRDYRVHGRYEGLPTAPVEFGPRLDGSNDPARVVRPGVIAPPPDSAFVRSNPPPSAARSATGGSR